MSQNEIIMVTINGLCNGMHKSWISTEFARLCGVEDATTFKGWHKAARSAQKTINFLCCQSGTNGVDTWMLNAAMEVFCSKLRVK